MKVAFTRGLLPAAIVMVGLSACGGGSGGDSQLAGGGISGTGTGTITGFGSIIINEIRTFAIDANTRILWDGSPITEQQLIQRGTGSIVNVEIGSDVNADFTGGTAVNIHISNLVKGPVTSLNPLQVLGQDVVLTADTVYFQDDAPAANFGLNINDQVEVSGFADSMGTILASRIERVVATALPAWKIAGTASAPATTGSFNIGLQEVELGAVIPHNCAGGVVSPGDFVEVEANVDPLFNPGDILSTVTVVECVTPGLPIPANASSTVLKAEVEGLVTSINQPQLVINGQTVTVSAGTIYEGGTLNDIDIGSKLEAEGDLNTTTRILSADKIRFRDRRVRIEAPATLPLGSSFSILQVINVNTSALTEDNDNLVNSGSGNRQVEVRGYLDANDEVIATRVRDRGAADTSQVSLRGPVGGNTCNPAITDQNFDILTVSVDTASAQAFADVAESPLSEQAFCDLATTGTFIQVEDGRFFSGPARIDDASLIEIED